MSNSFNATFSLDPSSFPYSKKTLTAKRSARSTLQNQLFFDLVLAEVARIPEASKLYPPRTISDLRSLHESIENCPVDLLKKQCCIYYILRDWNTHNDYATNQLIPKNYCALMDAYWYLDNLEYLEGLGSLTTPGLTPNFATKIMSTFSMAGQDDMLLMYVHTLQNPLDTEEKIRMYLKALVKVDVSRAILFTRTTTELRQSLFESVIEHAKTDKDGVRVLADFPYDEAEEKWMFDKCSQTPGPGLEALVLRLTMLGDLVTVVRLRDKFGGGRADLNNGLRGSIHQVELKLLESAQ